MTLSRSARARAARVVVIVFDGLRPDVVTPSLTPALHAFAMRSSWFREARSVFPSMTRVASTSIATGATPRVHGIVGNAFYFPQALPDHAIDTSDLSDVTRAEAKLGRSLYDAPCFADALAAAGRRLCIVHTGSAGSSLALNPRAAANRHWTYSIHGPGHTRTPEAVEEVTARFGPPPARALPRHGETAYAATIFRELVLTEKRPDVALIWFNEPDTSYHYKLIGSAETLGMLRAADEALAGILATIDADPDAADTAVIVASDHGQISSRGVFDMAAALTAAGHPARLASERTLEGAQLSVTGGNMGEIRVLDGDLDRRDAIARWLMERDEVGMVFTPSAGPLRGAVEGAFATSLLRVDHAREPELFYILRSDTHSDAFGHPGAGLITGGVPLGGGMHGGVNRHELGTMLAVGGGAMPRQGVFPAPVGIIDIAPTILDLLGLDAPATMEGTSLLAIDGMDPGETSVAEAGAGAFRQRLEWRRSGDRWFLWHGGRA